MKEVRNTKALEIKKHIIVDDFNQDATYNCICSFMNENEVRDIYKEINNMQDIERDSMYQKEKNKLIPY